MSLLCFLESKNPLICSADPILGGGKPNNFTRASIDWTSRRSNLKLEWKIPQPHYLRFPLQKKKMKQLAWHNPGPIIPFTGLDRQGLHQCPCYHCIVWRYYLVTEWLHYMELLLSIIFYKTALVALLLLLLKKWIREPNRTLIDPSKATVIRQDSLGSI